MTPISNKVAASTLAAAVTTILAWVLNTGLHVEIPDFVQGAITTILVFVAGWVVPSGELTTLQTVDAPAPDHGDTAVPAEVPDGTGEHRADVGA